MEKRLEYLSGITSQEATLLRAVGVRHTNQLLHATTIAFDRQRLSRKTGIAPDRLCEFARQCSLMEITGLTPYLDQMRRVGIHGPKDLRMADPKALQERLLTTVGPFRAPVVTMVEYWISQARCIDILDEEGQIRPASWSSPSVFGEPPGSIFEELEADQTA